MLVDWRRGTSLLDLRYLQKVWNERNDGEKDDKGWKDGSRQKKLRDWDPKNKPTRSTTRTRNKKVPLIFENS